jgi:hypothetical protein
MKIARSIGLLVIGLVMGALISSSMSAVHAQHGSSPSRLVFTTIEKKGQASELVFIKDLRTSGCWLAVETSQGVISLATAPTEACSFK